MEGDPTLRVVIAATFTAEPLERSLRFWVERLGWRAAIEFCPFNQVLQQLLDPRSLVAENRSGANVLLIRPEDWLRTSDRPFDATRFSAPSVRSQLSGLASEFVSAIRTSVVRGNSHCLVTLLPPAPATRAVAPAYFETLEEKLTSELSSTSGVSVISSADLLRTYSVSDFLETSADEQGQIPLTEEGFAALGTAIARRIRALKHASMKVIVVDADNTLWGGVVAEDGPDRLRLEPGHLALQRTLRDQKEAGRLICLCSKNLEADVWSVFERRAEMILRREDFVASRINWRSKAQNLQELAEVLNLGLSSFLFLDDNPTECANIESSCPQVSTIVLPGDPASFGEFTEHVWAFDRGTVTEEDLQRTDRYRQTLQRNAFQQQAQSLPQFLAGLRLEVEVRDIRSEELPRMAQLTERTNQFNATARRRSEAEVRAYLRGDRFHGWSIEVRDRFGDYGLVGLVLFEISGDVLCVDTFLLSCRALGKGVEYEMVAALGKYAVRHRLARIAIPLVKNARNQPMQEFLLVLRSATEGVELSDGTSQFAAQKLLDVRFDPSRNRVAPERIHVNPASAPTTSPERVTHAQSPRLFNWIAHEMRTAPRILEQIRAEQRRPRPPITTPLEAPISAEERFLARVWAKVLNLEEVGVVDNFFELGGTSIQGVHIVNEVQRSLVEQVHVAVLFKAPTISELVRVLRNEFPKTIHRLDFRNRETMPPTRARFGDLSDPETARRLLEQLPNLSDAEVDGLLSELERHDPAPIV